MTSAHPRTRAPRRRSLRHRASALVSTLILAAGAVFLALPVLWLVVTSLQSPLDAGARPPKFLFVPTLENFGALSDGDFYRSLVNSVIVMIGGAAIALLLGVPAGYALSKSRFRGQRPFVGWLAFVYITPALIWIIPMFAIFQAAGLLGSYVSMIVFYETALVPMVVFLMASFFADLPPGLEEAAKLDGATPLQTFLRVVLPNALPGIASVTTLLFIVSWGEYYGALIFSSPSTKTVPVALASYLGQTADGGILAAGGLFVAVPVMVLTVFAQRGYLARYESGSTG